MKQVGLMENGQIKKDNRYSASCFSNETNKDLENQRPSTLVYFDLDNSKEMEEKFICTEIR